MPSLRARLVTRTAGIVALAFVMAALGLYFLMRAALLAEIDAALLLEARALTSHVEKVGAQIDFELDMASFPEYAAVSNPHFFQIRDPEGKSLVRSPSLGNRDIEFDQSASARPTYNFVTLPTGPAGRAVRVVFHPRPEDDDERASGAESDVGQDLTLSVARQTGAFEATLATLRWMLLAVTLAAAALSVILTSGVIQREMRPVQSLADSIGRMGAADLSQRIAVSNCPDEVVPVVQRLNDLLGRLDEALTREKSFTADAAHELRTPLAGLETALEVCASRPREPQAYQAVVLKCLRITQGLHSLVNNLLVLARADARQLTTHRETVELASCLRDCWSEFERRAAQRNLGVQWDVEQGRSVSIDRDKTRMILTNLFDNAVTYADESGRLRIAAASPNGALQITITNSGCRLSPADARRVFDRFWRGDEARSEAGFRTGIGLSLCHKIVALLGGTISARVERGEFMVVVQLPSDAAQSSSPPIRHVQMRLRKLNRHS